MPLPRFVALAPIAVTAALCGSAASAELPPSLNLSGQPGVIDMPSGEAREDAAFSFSAAFLGPVTRGTISFQISERLSGSFRFQTWRDWNRLFPSDDTEFSDRSFDLRYLILRESPHLPAVSIGLIDFTGDGRFSSEYIAATKNFGERVKVTGGLGWGRLGSYGSIGAPFGDRPALTEGDFGKPNAGQWFRGDAAPFAGVEIRLTDTWTFKGEYSSDAHLLEDAGRGIIDRASPFNFGFEYQRGPSVRYGIYALHGTEVGFVFHLLLDPKNRVTGGVMGPAPAVVKTRPARTADPAAYDAGWVTQPDAGPLLRQNLARRLAVDGIVIENLAFTASTVQVRIRNNRIDAGAQAIGRTARALSHVMPASVELFEIVPVVNGIGASRITIRRSDLEALEYAPDNATLLRERVAITDAGPLPANAIGDDGLYPSFHWGLRPAFRMVEPMKFEFGARLSAAYDLRPGLILQGSIYGNILDNLDRTGAPSTSSLPPVRSDAGRYSKFGNPALESLALAWFARPAEDFYTRVSFGYLERMHAGISTEVLWKPVDSPLALGVELNYTKQRDTDGLLGFDEYDYDVVTGHVSAYYDFGNGYLGQLDLGRYLAGDVGATIAVDRVFVNGWRVGAFATLTDADEDGLGEAAFDKGVRFSVPLNWALGNQGKQTMGATMRVPGGDAGARLEVNGRLHDLIRDYHTGALDPEWGRVWR